MFKDKITATAVHAQILLISKSIHNTYFDIKKIGSSAEYENDEYLKAIAGVLYEIDEQISKRLCKAHPELMIREYDEYLSDLLDKCNCDWPVNHLLKCMLRNDQKEGGDS